MVLMGLCFLAACSDDEAVPVVLTDPAEMYVAGEVFSGESLSLQVNGQTSPDFYLTFEPVAQDSTQLKITIGNMLPGHEANVWASFTPGEGVVTFESTVQLIPTDSYVIQISGTYYAEAATSAPRVQAECMLATGYSLTDIPFEYHFAKNVLSLGAGPGGTMEWQGQTIEKWDFIQSVLDKIAGRIAKEVTDMRLMFHANGTFDTWLKRAGQADYELWMTARYWIEFQTMYWILTPEQHTQFCEQWLGSLSFDDDSPFRRIEASETVYELPILFWGSSEQFNWTIWNPYRFTALDLYLKGRGMEGLTEEERQEMELFGRVLRDVEDPTDWMAWNITLRSEPISPYEPDWSR